MNLKKTATLSLIICVSILSFQPVANAQILKKIGKKLENKVDKEVDKLMDREENNTAIESSSTERIVELEQPSAHYNNEDLIFEDDFENTVVGDMPVLWKTHSSGSVVELADKEGKWLKLQANSTYKIDSLIDFPENFAIEFELITSSEQSKDIGAMGFGLAKDNAASSYMMDAYNDNAICYSQLHFHNNEINTGSSDTKASSFIDFPFDSYANTAMKIQFEVSGKNVRLTVDGEKVLDSQLLENKKALNFFLSAPFNYKNNAQVYFGNFKIFKL